MTGEVRQVIGEFVEILGMGLAMVVALSLLAKLTENMGIPILTRSRTMGVGRYTNPVAVAIGIALFSAIAAAHVAFSYEHLPQVGRAAVLVGAGTFVLVGMQCLLGWIALRKSPNPSYGVFLGILVGISTVNDLSSMVREAYRLVP